MTNFIPDQKKSNLKLKTLMSALKKNQVVALSSDTIVGLSAMVNSVAAIKKIITLKKRSTKMGLILLANKTINLENYVAKSQIEDLYNQSAKQSKPTTFIVKATKKINPLILGRHKKQCQLAIRITDNFVIDTICSKLKMPIISTSANIHKKQPANTKMRLKVYFKNNLAQIYINKNNHLKQSQIIDLNNSKIIRQ